MRIQQTMLIAALFGAATAVGAQRSAQVTDTVYLKRGTPQSSYLIVQTVPLHRLSPREAVKLLSPYVVTAGAGVFEVSPFVQAVTLKEVPKVFDEMKVLLAKYDRPPATMVLTFNIIVSDGTGVRDPAVAGLDSTLRQGLRFYGYRLVGRAVATATEGDVTRQAMDSENDRFELRVRLSDLQMRDGDSTVFVDVDLCPPPPALLLLRWTAFEVGYGDVLLSSRVALPIGKTVVLGTSITPRFKERFALTARVEVRK
jgi:hypothetical protein